MTDSLSRIHEELSLKGQKQMSHTSECTWHLFHAVRGRRFMAAAQLWISSLLAGGCLLAKRAARPVEARRWALTYGLKWET